MKINNLKTKKSGFTLIELLVVVAIIAVLSTVVVSNLGSARNKGLDAAVKSQLSQLRTIAEDFYGSNGNMYNTSGTAIAACPTTVSASNFLASASGISALAQIDVNGVPNTMTCGISADGEAWAVSIKLKSSSKYFCVDSTGNINNLDSAVTAGAVVCP